MSEDLPLRADAVSEREGMEREVLADLEKRGQRLAEVAVAATTPTDLLALALEKGLDTETLSRFMDLQERYEATEARKAYAADMVKAQKGMPAVVATSPNEQTDSFFAKLGVLVDATKPVYTKHGFSVSFGEGVPAKEGDVRITAKVMHRLGHFEDFFYDLPPDVAGPQGNVNKTAIHGKASSTSYAQRYLTKMIWNVAILGEDDDGNAAGGPAPGRITDEQAMQLDALCTENELKHAAVQREFRVAGWSQIPANKFDKVHDRIQVLIQDRNSRR